MTLTQQTAITYLRRFPNAATMTLAKTAYQENPELWPSLEACRVCFRRFRGASGEDLKSSSLPEFIREKGNPKNPPFAKMPEGIKHFEDWKVFGIAGPLKVLAIGDTHCPYHNEKAIVAALDYGKKRGADTILLTGDIGDFFSVSFWEKDPRKRNFATEIEVTKAFLYVIRETFPKARIIFKLGNHEERFIRYMQVKAPELLGLECFEINNVLGLDNLGMEMIGDNRPMRVGDLHVLHGHEYRFPISNPVSPARGLFNRGKAHCACWHFHQTSQHSEKNLEGKVVSTWSVGALCDMHPDYKPLNNWNLGFMFVDIDSKGAFQVDNLRIINGNIYH